MTGQILLQQKVGRNHTPERTFWVSNSFEDNPTIGQFSTIQTAITYIHDSSWYSDLDDNNYAVILTYPGQYYEQLTSWAYIRVKSVSDDINIGLYKSVQLNPPADKKNEPMLIAGSDYRYDIEGFTMMSDSVANGPYAYTLRQADFHNCLFENGSFLENSGNYASDMRFINCNFYSGTDAFDMTGTRGHTDRQLYFDNTWIDDDIITTSTIASGNATIKFRGCPCSCKLVTGGDWNLVVKNTIIRNSTGSPNRNTFSTTGCIKIEDSGISGGIHFTSAPSSLCINNCNFNTPFSTAIIGADITSDVTIPNVSYANNLQQNGISGKIKTICPIKNVGCKAPDRYITLQDAVDSITTTGVVDLRESLTGLSELVIPTGVNVTIFGHKLYSLAFTGDVVELGASEQIVFYALTKITGGNIEVNGNNSYVGFEECLTVAAYVTLTSGTGTYCLVYTSTIKAPTGHPAITLNNVNTGTIAGYSRIDGGVGHPAVLITAEADNKVKAKFSTLMHGDGGANAPLVYTGPNKIDISFYNCGLNASWDPSDFNNTIGAANNTTDPGIDF